MEPLIIRKMNAPEIQDVLSLQKACYVAEGELYNNFSIQPLTQTIEAISSDYQNGEICLIAVLQNKIIAAVRAKSENKTAYIGKLIVHPVFQNIGIGKRMMNAIEQECCYCARYELFTGHKSAKNIYLYQKLGYTVFKEERINAALTLLYLEKLNNNYNNDFPRPGIANR